MEAGDHFKLLAECPAGNNLVVKKFQSTQTGLSVVVTNVPGPLVHGFLAVGTEAFDDDGLPHTLEHLVFLGSESYPYKGILDIIANRCLASGTNAWTEIDHTAYTVTTAGSKGFLTLLPIYLDHVLYPTLTESGFVTEIHHINKDGLDAGVVYCEMQGRETSAESLAELELLRTLYPPNCPYRYETGGILKNLRESTNLEKIRNYHSKYYRPENLVVIVSGPINEKDIFEALAPVEEKILKKNYEQEFIKPFADIHGGFLKESVIRRIAYPSDVEDSGLVYFGWEGPSSANQHDTIACILLLTYMTETPVSPFMKYFVESANPACSGVSFVVAESAASLMYLCLEDVNVNRMADICNEVEKVLDLMFHDAEGFTIDEDRMKTVISNFKLHYLSRLEKNPHEEIARIIICDMLYSKSMEDTYWRLNASKTIDILSQQPTEFWKETFVRFFHSVPYAAVIASPSKQEQKRREIEEKERIHIQKENLGPEGLKFKEKMLSAAVKENNKKAPSDLIMSVPIPQFGPETISFYPVAHYSTKSVEQHPMFDTTDCPVFMHLDDVQSHFVYLYVLLDANSVPSRLRGYVPLLTEYLLETPVKRNGQIISYEDVSRQIEEDLLNYKMSVGVKGSRFLCGAFSECISFYLQVPIHKYREAVQWIHELLFCVVISESRLLTVAHRIINSVAQARRDGGSISVGLMRAILYKNTSYINLITPLRQQRFLLDMIDKVQAGPVEKNMVVEDLKILMANLTSPKNIIIHMGCDVKLLTEHYENPSILWKSLLPDTVEPFRKSLNVPADFSVLKDGSEREMKCCVTGMGSIESVYLCITTPGLQECYHRDYAPLLVFIQYLTQLEGPLWRQLRGCGLTYSYNLTVNVNEGQVFYSCSKATNVVEAFIRSKNIISKLLHENTWDTNYFESAKSSLIFELVQEEKNVKFVILESLFNYLRHTNQDYNRVLIRNVLETGVEDMERVGKQYVLPLFDPAKAKVTVVCNGAKCNDIAKAIQGLGFELNVFPTLEESYLSPSYYS